jgi:hypothetical protein
MAATSRDLGFTSCKADPDVWMRPAEKKDGFQYYEYVLVYVDDVFVYSPDPMGVIKYLTKVKQFKATELCEPKR